MVSRLWLDEPNSRVLSQDNCSNRKYNDCAHYSLYRIQKQSLHRIRPISISAWVHRHWGNSLRAHLRLLLGTNTSYSGGKMDICLSPSLRVNKIVSAIPCWQMSRIFLLVDSHVHGIT